MRKMVRKIIHLSVKKKKREILNITMSQNIPNPANENTLVLYSVPEEGEVTFRIYGDEGQTLYSQTLEAATGAHSIEINTSELSTGIYFYSMKFKKQHVMKKMNIMR
jgi:hypothetical protein